MKKIALSISMIFLSACYAHQRDNHSKESISTGSVAKPSANESISKNSFKKCNSNICLLSLKKSWESDVFLIGWKASSDIKYDISSLTKVEREGIIEKGIEVLKNDADKKDHQKTNRTILAHYFYSINDYKKAMYWAFKGVEAGSASCMSILSSAYLNGEEGVVQDYEEGLMWAYLGATCGNEHCKKTIHEIQDVALWGSFQGVILGSQKKATQWMKEHSELFASSNSTDERIL